MIGHKNYPISYTEVLKARRVVYNHLMPTHLNRYNDLSSLIDASTIMAAIKLKQKLKGKKVVLQFSGCNASPDEINKAYSSRLFSEGWIGG